MPRLTHELTLAAPPAVVFEAVRATYVDPRHEEVWRAVKKRAPTIRVVSEEPPARLVLDVSAYDALTGVTHRGWTVTIDLERTASGSVVRVEYRWGMALAIAALGAIREQAANDLLALVRLLIAVERASPTSGPFR